MAQRSHGALSHSHVDPLLQGLPEVFLADGVCQGPQGRPEFHHGLRQVLEPAAQLQILLQHPSSPWNHSQGSAQHRAPSCPHTWAGAGLTCGVLARGALQGGEEQPTGQGWVRGHPLGHGVEESVGLVQRGGEQLHQGTHLSLDSCTCTEGTVSQGSPSAQLSDTVLPSREGLQGKGLSLMPHLLPHQSWAWPEPLRSVNL